MAIIQSLNSQVSGFLLDVKTGLPAYQLFNSIKNKPFVLASERSGYVIEKNDERITKIEYPVLQLRRLGADGVKLLVFFNPFTKTAALQLRTAGQIFLDCQKNNLPFFLEIITYHTDQSIKKKANLVLESVKRFLAESLRADVFKLEYPGSQSACLELTKLLKNIPWLLLTRGENFEIFKYQLQTASQFGCRGFLAGRAIWQEIGQLKGKERDNFLNQTIKERFKEAAEIVLK